MRRGRRRTTLAAVAALALGALGAAAPLPNAALPLPNAAAGLEGGGYNPLPESAIPKTKFGDMVRLGRDIFLHTKQYAGRYVGSDLSCSNCHVDAGRMAGSAPLWAAYISFPTYRAKSGKVNSFEQRLQGCFHFSENGTAPPLGSKTLIALESYAYWLATGLPVNTQLPGRGYPAIARPAKAPDYARGAKVYAVHCAMCHGAGGEGRAVNATVVFPPLWGPHSFNWGAGMASYNNAAKFIRANMSLGLSYSLSPHQAWDVAYFIDAQERPQDPRWLGSVKATRAKFHASRFSLYGRSIDGRLLGDTGAPAKH